MSTKSQIHLWQSLSQFFFAGTGSDVGKSIITAGFCRIFKEDGFNPAPYKAQNMALNSYATPEGFEIGRAQAMQAEAARIPCHTDMNPVLLKPSNDLTSQVVLNGKPIGNYSAQEYFNNTGRETLFKEVSCAFHRLSKRNNPVVMEGAGSISEINLWKKDITNMRIAKEACASVFLIADIDRGGVFGSIYGTIELLPQEEKDMVKGIIINKFRGDLSLFDDGKKILEDLTKKPVVGVIPYFKDIHLDEEDSVSLEAKKRSYLHGKVNIAVVLLKRLSNFTDFKILELDERVNLFYTQNPKELEKADIIVIPGSKNTIGDLMDLRAKGVVASILKSHNKGKTVIGICGGFQMLGHKISDPDFVEGEVESYPGIGILPIETKILKKKITTQRKFNFLNSSEICQGYEIHMGETIKLENTPSLNKTTDHDEEGCFLSSKCWGTYMHGILDNNVVIDYLLKDLCKSNGDFDIFNFKEEQYNRLAMHIRKHVNLNKIYSFLT